MSSSAPCALQTRELVGAGRGRDDARAEQLAELNRGQTDAAGGAEDEQRLARFHLRPIGQRVDRGAVSRQHGGGLHEADAGGNGHEPRRVGGHLLGVTAPRHERDDAIARLDVRDARADGVDDAGHLTAGRERRLGAELILAGDDQRVGEVDAAGLDGDDGLPG